MRDLGIFGLGIPQVNHITLHPYTQSSLCHTLLSHYSLCPLLPSSMSPPPSLCHSNACHLRPLLHIKPLCAHEPILGLGAGFVPLKDQKLTLHHFGSHSVDSVSLRSPQYHHPDQVPVGFKTSLSVIRHSNLLSVPIILSFQGGFDLESSSCISPSH